jgi:hypothetical protein
MRGFQLLDQACRPNASVKPLVLPLVDSHRRFSV